MTQTIKTYRNYQGDSARLSYSYKTGVYYVSMRLAGKHFHRLTFRNRVEAFDAFAADKQFIRL